MWRHFRNKRVCKLLGNKRRTLVLVFRVISRRRYRWWLVSWELRLVRGSAASSALVMQDRRIFSPLFLCPILQNHDVNERWNKQYSDNSNYDTDNSTDVGHCSYIICNSADWHWHKCPIYLYLYSFLGNHITWYLLIDLIGTWVSVWLSEWQLRRSLWYRNTTNKFQKK